MRHQGHPDLLDPWEMQEHREPQEIQVEAERPDLPELVELDCLVQPELLVLQVQWDHLDQTVGLMDLHSLAHLEWLDRLVIPEDRVWMELRVHLEFLAKSDLTPPTARVQQGPCSRERKLSPLARWSEHSDLCITRCTQLFDQTEGRLQAKL